MNLLQAGKQERPMTKSSTRTLSIFLLAMINVSAICSIKNWPLTAEYGFASLFYFLLAGIFFFIPVSLVSAELATGWPQRGGVYVWVREAFGHRAGFLAAWLLWVENVVWYPTILSFIAGTIAFSVHPQLATHPGYMFLVILASFWGLTALNLFGMKVSGWISSIGVILGTLVPGIIIIALGGAWLASGNPSSIGFGWSDLIPRLNTPAQLSLLAGVLLGFGGMEMSAVHAREVKNPQHDYPRAILLSAVLIIALSVLGTLAIAIIIPQQKISLVSGGIAAIARVLDAYQWGGLTPLIALLVSLGALGTVSTWVAGPNKGLLAAAQDGDFPPLLHRINRHNMPVALLILQAIIVSCLSALFLFMPTINSSFWLLLALASQLYLVMYILMFLAAIILRFTRPNQPRAYRIPGGHIGMIVVAGLGLLGALFTLVISFFPPTQFATGNALFYCLFLGAGMVLFCSAPFLILLFKKPSWKTPIPFKEDN